MKKDLTDEEIKEIIAHKAIKQIATIYKIEETLKDLSEEERLKRRELSVKPLVEAYFENMCTWNRVVCFTVYV